MTPCYVSGACKQFKIKKMTKILNTWQSGPALYEVEQPIYVNGDFAIYKQFEKCYLHTYKDVAIKQLVKPNKMLILHIINGTKPDNTVANINLNSAKLIIKKRYPEFFKRNVQQTLF
jgi:hypothetical protein